MPEKKKTKVCKTCGSEDVFVDASVEWSVDKQDWIIRGIYDSDYCCDCDGETTIIDKELPDAKS